VERADANPNVRSLPPQHSGLSPAETRVLGCLLEKQRTTPDMYPLTLNALRLACNQSTNREPVAEYDDGVVRDALHRLERRGFTRLASGRGSRAPKYRHLLADALPMAEDEQALMCVLMLRGPQTPGELKQRAERMHGFAGLEAVQETLERLLARRLVSRVGRRPGQKEERYAQLLGQPPGREGEGGGEPAPSRAYEDGDAGAPAPEEREGAAGDPPAWVASLYERLERLEREVARLQSAREGSGAAVGSGTTPRVGE
jgi:hypothetical protein